MTSPASPIGSRALAPSVMLLACSIGCSEPETIELVATHGCGLEQEFSGLRVRVLGDFAVASGTEIVLGPGQRGSIPSLPDGATGIAAEGLFGTTVTAIGRSWGIDPELARGRIPGIDSDAAIVPVYFAAPDSLCELESQPSARSQLAAAAGPSGDVLLAGGVDAEQALLDELVHVDLFTNEARTLSARLPSPRRGASVHAVGGRRFAVLGGATSGGVVDERVDVDVRGQGSVTVSSGSARVAHHASASGADGRVLIAGGCDEADASGACVPASALATALWMDLEQASEDEALPELERARFGAHAIVARDGVAFVAGGFDAQGLGLGSVERLRPGDDAWSIVHELPDELAIAGLALLDGGLVLLGDRLGGVHFWSESGSGTLDPTSRAPALGPVDGERPLLALPGERVLVDSWLFAPATAAVDPALERVRLSEVERSDATLVQLADGSALIVGGSAVEPTIMRLRPELDGPDEWIPDLAGPQTDAFVCNVPGRATVILGGLQLHAEGLPDDVIPPVRAHVRGFRSGALRLELEVDSDPGTVAHVVVGQGALSLLSIALHTDEVVVHRRAATGAVESLDCAHAGAAPGAELVLELADEGRQLRLTSDVLLAECALEWPSNEGLAIGFGVSGTGSARFFDLRLARR